MMLSVGGSSSFRVNNDERESAVAALQRLFSTGYLDVTAFDDRCAKAYQAITRGDLDALFADIPPSVLAEVASPATDIATRTSSSMDVYEAARLGKRRLRAAMILTVTGSLSAAIAFDHPIILMIIPVVYALLYVAQIGPKSWYIRPPNTLLTASVLSTVRKGWNSLTQPPVEWQVPHSTRIPAPGRWDGPSGPATNTRWQPRTR